MMKSVLIGVVAVAAAALATPALAQAVIEDPGYCVQFYSSANCQNPGPSNPYTNGGYYRDWLNRNAMMPVYSMQWAEVPEYRYHGGPKTND